ncbi:Transcriptional regulator TetR family protein [Salinisphaera shabanensis E1L3A]|jgi:AcrR family transcriptional regulator|uniref:Transcriptional regulator TetR family protein n=1 Tax=Salinisphaera shabanensis E1L3A TaxID=1033802 RepID=F7Q871_9GAMM|nr:TetR/AcrR family transcriptional regulator [Salinisphaera shabanensis]ERJ17766.1 Transcriptional regulator TetR family protein [Salinisphaera shabanensis E1L3A]
MRKKPRQARAQRRVDDLIEATALEIIDRGLVETTTNHIAARAGVSIGSLYQYFESKPDLVLALIERLSGQILEAVDEALVDVLAADTRAAVERLLQATLTVVDRRPALYLELMRHWQTTGVLTVIEALEDHTMEVCRRYVLRHHQRLQIDDLRPVLFVIVNATLFPLMRYLSMAEPGFDREVLIAALSDMVAGYVETALVRAS